VPNRTMAVRIVVPLVAAVCVLVVAYLFSLGRQSADLLLVQALTAPVAPVRGVAAAVLERKGECPREDFLPTTAVGFLVAGWHGDVPAGRANTLLQKLVDIGCDVNRRGTQGLTPLHSAILFDNRSAVVALLQYGADPGIKTRIHGAGGTISEYDAVEFARRVEAGGSDDRTEILTLLIDHHGDGVRAEPDVTRRE